LPEIIDLLTRFDILIKCMDDSTLKKSLSASFSSFIDFEAKLWFANDDGYSLYYLLLVNAPESINEKNRLIALKRYEILDTPAKLEFDDLTQLASLICQTPISLISLVDETRQWFKSRVGIEVCETHRSLSFCQHAIEGSELMEIADALEDERFCNNPLVTGEPYIRFYAGAPLTTPDGHRIGTLCVIDQVPRRLSREQRDGLVRLARHIMRQLESRVDHAKLIQSSWALRESYERTEQIIDSALDAVVAMDMDGLIISWNPQAEVIFGWSAGEVIGQKMSQVIIPPSYREAYEHGHRHFVQTGQTTVLNRRLKFSALRQDGTEFPVELTIAKVMVGGKAQFSAFIRDLSEWNASEAKLARASDLLRAVGRLQSSFISRGSICAAETFEELLQLLLNFTGSEYGFVAEVLLDEQGQPYLKTHAITNIAWNVEMQDFYEKHKAKGLEFRNLNTLLGAAVVTGETVISNSPATDPRRGGLPPGHPPLNSFLSVPIKQGAEMIGMVGVSNRPGGYDMALVEEIEPLLSTYATIIRGLHLSKQKEADQHRIAALNSDLAVQAGELAAALRGKMREKRERLDALEEHATTLERRVAERTDELVRSKQQFQDLFEFAPDALVMTNPEGIIQMTNHRAERLFGWTHTELLGQPLEVLLPTFTKIGRSVMDGVFFEAVEKHSLLGRCKDGTEFPLELSLSPVQTEDGALLAVALRDISERRQLEQELARISSHEQERIAHELHDHLGAYLAGIAFRFKSLAETLDRLAIPEAANAQQLVGQVNEGIDLVRNYARLLAPVDLEVGGLQAGLSQLGKEMEAAFRIECRVEVATDLPPLTPEQSMQLYRIAQEAIRNAIQHGNARLVTISVLCEPNHLKLIISNDGKPWSPNPQRKGGLGLRIMRHRAVNIGGTLILPADSADFTSVTCLLPLRSAVAINRNHNSNS
jgi:PAS domain S-box-containing protein